MPIDSIGMISGVFILLHLKYMSFVLSILAFWLLYILINAPKQMHVGLFFVIFCVMIRALKSISTFHKIITEREHECDYIKNAILS